MPVIDPQITVFSGLAGTTMTNFFEVIENHYRTGQSTKFTYNGGPSPTTEGFILTPVDESNSYWQLNFRRVDATTANLMLDPGASITDPGSTAAAPTGASVKASAEKPAWDLSLGTVGTTLILIELKDAIFLVHIDAGSPASHNPVAVHAGKIYVPWFSNDNGTGDGQGDNYADGLGICGGVTLWATTGANTVLGTISNATRNTARGAETLWFTPFSEFLSPNDNRIDDKRKPRPFNIALDNTDGSSNATIGYSKYLLLAGDPSAQQLPGTKEESATDAWCRIRSTATSTNQIIPWDLTTTPPF